MSNLTDFFPSGGGGGLTPKFEEFNASGTFTPTQALIDAGGYIEIFLVGGGASTGDGRAGGGGGEVFQKKMYLTNTNSIAVTIGAGAGNAIGGSTTFLGSSAGGQDLTATGGSNGGVQSNQLGAGFGSGQDTQNEAVVAAGSGVMGYGVGGSTNSDIPNRGGVATAKANSGQGSKSGGTGGSGYCLIKWYE